MIISIAAVIAFLLLSAFFSGSETALTGASQAFMLDQEKNEHNPKAKTINRLFKHRDKLIITTLLGSNLFNTMFALVIVSWPTYARLMRSVVLSVKENEYVNAAEALGASRMRILLKEIIPNSVSSVLIMATTDIGNKILMFSTLSFLGLGSAPPTPEWGMMVSDGVDYFNKFWVAGFPGLAIFTMAVGANFIGDGLRDLLDPKLRTQF